jgi:hypothetical protein
MPTTCMIPMADNINHSPSSVLNEVIHIEQHAKGDQSDENYYHPIKFFNDYSHIYDKFPEKKP